jgi:hypothetical protein
MNRCRSRLIVIARDELLTARSREATCTDSTSTLSRGHGCEVADSTFTVNSTCGCHRMPAAERHLTLAWPVLSPDSWIAMVAVGPAVVAGAMVRGELV